MVTKPSVKLHDEGLFPETVKTGLGSTVISIVWFVAQTRLSGAYVQVVRPGKLLTVAGLHTPFIPFVDVVGNTGEVVFSQKSGTALKVGITSTSTVISTVCVHPLKSYVIVVIPAPIELTTPEPSIVATAVFEELHVPPTGSPIKVCVSPFPHITTGVDIVDELSCPST